MVLATEERHTNRPSNMNVKETCSPLLLLMMLIYPTLLGFVFAARLAMFSLLISTLTVPGAPLPDTGILHSAQDLWETMGDGAIVRTSFAFVSITVVHLVISFHLCARGFPGEAGYVCAASIALWFTTTCFFLTYTSMTRYGAHAWEWYVAVGFSFVILIVTVDFLRVPFQADKLVDDPATAIV